MHAKCRDPPWSNLLMSPYLSGTDQKLQFGLNSKLLDGRGCAAVPFPWSTYIVKGQYVLHNNSSKE